jgi:hypothetical protein
MPGLAESGELVESTQSACAPIYVARLAKRFLIKDARRRSVRWDGPERRWPSFLLAAGDEIVTVMGDQRGAGCVDTRAERRAALIAFLGAGVSSAPSTALMVEALAGARRAVAVYQAHGRAVDDWLAGEVRLRGIRENAAVLAVLELLPGRREATARAYRFDHPDRAGALSDLLAALDPPGSAAGSRGLL